MEDTDISLPSAFADTIGGASSTDLDGGGALPPQLRPDLDVAFEKYPARRQLYDQISVGAKTGTSQLDACAFAARNGVAPEDMMGDQLGDKIKQLAIQQTAAAAANMPPPQPEPQIPQVDHSQSAAAMQAYQQGMARQPQYPALQQPQSSSIWQNIAAGLVGLLDPRHAAADAATPMMYQQQLADQQNQYNQAKYGADHAAWQQNQAELGNVYNWQHQAEEGDADDRLRAMNMANQMRIHQEGVAQAQQLHAQTQWRQDQDILAHAEDRLWKATNVNDAWAMQQIVNQLGQRLGMPWMVKQELPFRIAWAHSRNALIDGILQKHQGIADRTANTYGLISDSDVPALNQNYLSALQDAGVDTSQPNLPMPLLRTTATLRKQYQDFRLSQAQQALGLSQKRLDLQTLRDLPRLAAEYDVNMDKVRSALQRGDSAGVSAAQNDLSQASSQIWSKYGVDLRAGDTAAKAAQAKIDYMDSHGQKYQRDSKGRQTKQIANQYAAAQAELARAQYFSGLFQEIGKP